MEYAKIAGPATAAHAAAGSVSEIDFGGAGSRLPALSAGRYTRTGLLASSGLPQSIGSVPATARWPSALAALAITMLASVAALLHAEGS